jgi:phage terminase large subunit-like protein
LAFAFDDDGRLPYDTIIYSCPKKSGKTAVNGALTLWWAFTQESPNEILILANDLEQSLARVYKTMEGIIRHNPELGQETEIQTKTIYLNGRYDRHGDIRRLPGRSRQQPRVALI